MKIQSEEKTTDAQSKIWYWQDRYQSKPEKELQLDMNGNSSYNRIHVTPKYSLSIKSFEEADAGIYRCHGTNNEGADHRHNYRLERKI